VHALYRTVNLSFYEWFMGLVHGLSAIFSLDYSYEVYEYTPMQFWYVYVLQSQKDHMFYIGSTSDLKRRFQQHQRGENISTAKRLPFELIYFEGHRSKDDAWRREKYFKTTKGKVTLRKVLQEFLNSAYSVNVEK
jgi:putative endonuclease